MSEPSYVALVELAEYRKMLLRSIALVLGEQAVTNIDGSKSDDPVWDRLPKLVAELRESKEELARSNERLSAFVDQHTNCNEEALAEERARVEALRKERDRDAIAAATMLRDERTAHANALEVLDGKYHTALEELTATEEARAAAVQDLELARQNAEVYLSTIRELEAQLAVHEAAKSPAKQSASAFARAVDLELSEIRDMLVAKNTAYGNAALEPVRVFSKANPVEQLLVRIDDKLSRLARGSAAGEDTERDLLGYLVLLRIARRAAA